MPKLILFVACERVIVSQDNIPSIINILQRIGISLPTEDQIGRRGTLSPGWCAFSMGIGKLRMKENDTITKWYCTLLMAPTRGQ
jgi:hypothetical protein